MNSTISSGMNELNKVLRQLNQAGGFSIAVLTDQDGLAIASAAADGLDAEKQSAVVALIQKTAVQGVRQLGMGQSDEITFHDTGGQRLICRMFQVNGHDLILALSSSGRKQSYRRITNEAISEIQHLWKEYWG